MLFNPLYKYETLKRVELNGTRLYETPGGKVSSVTTILDSTKDKTTTAAVVNTLSAWPYTTKVATTTAATTTTTTATTTATAACEQKSW